MKSKLKSTRSEHIIPKSWQSRRPLKRVAQVEMTLLTPSGLISDQWNLLKTL